MTLRITLLRHAEAEPAAAGMEDYDRPLTRRGHAQAMAAARRLAKVRLAPDLVLLSPAKRTVSTAVAVAKEFNLGRQQILSERALYQADAQTIWEQVRRLADEVRHVLICGHNPGISDLAGRFGPERRTRRLDTAGIVSATWHGTDWSTLRTKDAARTDTYDPNEQEDS
jgi:phosphohistidine phosphatase